MWQPSVRTFRWITAITLVVHLLMLADHRWSILPASEEFREVRSVWAAADSFLTSDQQTRAYWLGNGLLAICLFGMLFLSDLSRWCTLFVAIFNSVIGPMQGTYAFTPWETGIGTILGTSFSMAMAIAFLSPVALHFTGQAESAGTAFEDE
jgi:hypothetical protein